MNIFFLIPFLLFPVFADNTDIAQITTGIETIKKFDVTSIELGSRVESAVVTVNLNDDINRLCVMKISDPFLNEMPISESFRCSGQMPVMLNQNGKYFVENQIKIGEIAFVVKHVDDNTDVESTVDSTNISFTKPTYFAKVKNNIVTHVIVADSSFVETQEGTWIETFLDDRYAGKGYVYDSKTNSFESPYKIEEQQVKVIEP